MNDLVEVVLPPTLFEKGKAFEDCNSLTGINIPDFIKYIGDDAFRGCNINVTVPKSCALCSGNEGITQ